MNGPRKGQEGEKGNRRKGTKTKEREGELYKERKERNGNRINGEGRTEKDGNGKE